MNRRCVCGKGMVWLPTEARERWRCDVCGAKIDEPIEWLNRHRDERILSALRSENPATHESAKQCLTTCHQSLILEVAQLSESLRKPEVYWPVAVVMGFGTITIVVAGLISASGRGPSLGPITSVGILLSAVVALLYKDVRAKRFARLTGRIREAIVGRDASSIGALIGIAQIRDYRDVAKVRILDVAPEVAEDTLGEVSEQNLRLLHRLFFDGRPVGMGDATRILSLFRYSTLTQALTTIRELLVRNDPTADARAELTSYAASIQNNIEIASHKVTLLRVGGESAESLLRPASDVQTPSDQLLRREDADA